VTRASELKRPHTDMVKVEGKRSQLRHHRAGDALCSAAHESVSVEASSQLLRVGSDYNARAVVVVYNSCEQCEYKLHTIYN
jgi:hypothetical protein